MIPAVLHFLRSRNLGTERHFPSLVCRRHLINTGTMHPKCCACSWRARLGGASLYQPAPNSATAGLLPSASHRQRAFLPPVRHLLSTPTPGCAFWVQTPPGPGL